MGGLLPSNSHLPSCLKGKMHGLLGAGPPRVVQPAFLVSSVWPVSTSHEDPLVKSQSPHLLAHFETKLQNFILYAITQRDQKMRKW